MMHPIEQCLKKVLLTTLQTISLASRAIILAAPQVASTYYLSTNYPEYESLFRIGISFFAPLVLKFLCNYVSQRLNINTENTADFGRRVATLTNNILSWPVTLSSVVIAQLAIQVYMHDAIPDWIISDESAHSAIDFIVGLFPEPFQPWVRNILP